MISSWFSNAPKRSFQTFAINIWWLLVWYIKKNYFSCNSFVVYAGINLSIGVCYTFSKSKVLIWETFFTTFYDNRTSKRIFFKMLVPYMDSLAKTLCEFGIFQSASSYKNLKNSFQPTNLEEFHINNTQLIFFR